MTEQENKELGKLIREILHDPNKIEQIYERTKKIAYSVARLYLKLPQDVDEAISDAYCTIVRKAPLFLENKNAYAWITKIVKHSALNLQKKVSRVREDVLDEVVFAESGDAIERTDDRMLVEECLAALTPIEREVIIYTYWEGFSLSEIGKILGKGKSSVKYILDRPEKKIRLFSEKYLQD